jgi:hypothetical protein
VAAPPLDLPCDGPVTYPGDIKTLRIPSKGRSGPKCIREKTGAENIVKEIKQYQEKWLQHIQRMDTNWIPKQALQYKPKGRRHIGRPRKRWRDQFHFEDTRNRIQT